MENIEINIFLPKLGSNLSVEINKILHIKEELSKASTGAYSIETVRDMTSKIVGYLKELSLCKPETDEENVVSHIIALQNATNQADPFDYLDDAEINALKNLVNRVGSNQFVALDRQRQDLELHLSLLDEYRSQKTTLEQTKAGGNEMLIKTYEEAKRNIEKLKSTEGSIKGEIQRLERRIHQYDVQIQQEPDVKYDTLVKLNPFFEKVADSLLKKKKAQIESEMQQQLNKLLVSYKGHIGRVELSESLENFNIKIFHTKGNQISLNQLNAASKQIFIQVLLKVLRNLGDYNPPVMIDTVMGVLDNESRDALMEEYFPQLAEQTILLCTTSEIRTDSDYRELEAFISKTYTLHRDVENQCTTVSDGYFGLTLNQ
jgi:DNA sulfur modification protein DndD